VCATFNRIFKESRKKSAFCEQRIRALLSLIITDLASACIAENERSLGKAHTDTDDASLTQAVMEEYVSHSFNKGASLAKLSRLIHMSERNTQRVFKRCFGATFGEYITKMRLDSAKYLLAETDMPYTAISAELGFATYSGFYNFFKKGVEKTPAEYREYKRKGNNQ
jgi:AraC-like DNA-binding protein